MSFGPADVNNALGPMFHPVKIGHALVLFGGWFVHMRFFVAPGESEELRWDVTS